MARGVSGKVCGRNIAKFLGVGDGDDNLKSRKVHVCRRFSGVRESMYSTEYLYSTYMSLEA